MQVDEEIMPVEEALSEMGYGTNPENLDYLLYLDDDSIVDDDSDLDYVEFYVYLKYNLTASQ